MLAERRDEVGRSLFAEVPALDFFRLESGRIVFHDLAAERNIYPHNVPIYRVRLAQVDERGRADVWTDWRSLTETEVSLEPEATDPSYPFLALEAQVRRHDGWSDSVRAYFSPTSGRTLAVER
jgi:hypothetical protein